MKPKCSKIDPERRPEIDKMQKIRGSENNRKNMKQIAKNMKTCEKIKKNLKKYEKSNNMK